MTRHSTDHSPGQTLNRVAWWRLFLPFLGILIGSAGYVSAATDETGKDVLGYPEDERLAREVGRADAHRDLSNRVVLVKTCGLPSPDRPDFAALLQQRCGAKLEPIGGCLVSSGMLAYLGGYNEVTRAFLQQKHGTNVFELLHAESKAAHQQRLMAKPPAAGKRTYRVKAGDTLDQLARRHAVKLADLMRSNPGVNPTRLQVNQLITIPTGEKP